MLHNHNATGNIANWAAELAEFELDFLMGHAVKCHVLVDFVAGWRQPSCHSGGPDDSELEVKGSIFTEPH
jgi:hypothetical protein